MCVRYTLHKTDEAMAAIAKALARKLAPPDWAGPKYNVTLTDLVPVAAPGPGGPEFRGMRWGLIPAYQRRTGDQRMWPNAKAEKARTSPTWREATKHRRCLVPANGFYEWETVGRMKYPHLFTLRDEEPFAFAGLWEPAGGDLPETFAILTTAPNALVGRYHDRMPVLLPAAQMARWIGSEPLAEDDFADLTRPLAPELMAERGVSRYLNKSGNEGPACHGPPEPRSGYAVTDDPSPQLDLGI